ncbi:MAG: YtxH domain-containing protein [Calditrichaeota bacterium]|nr:YtxH domain-containing protein [Calditrichota bacterium]MCB9087990.1 YtxH domain-containing protein [Calditrichia bacterium]
MSEQTNGAVEFTKGLLIGGIIGTVIGILYAPKSGKRTRREIYNKSVHLRNDAEAKLMEAQEKTAEVLDEAASRFETARRDAEAALRNIKEKTAGLIETGKSKLTG